MTHNVQLSRVGSRLIIEIDLAEKGQPSASGKSTVLGSTRGNIDVPGCSGVKLGVNCYAYDGYSID